MHTEQAGDARDRLFVAAATLLREAPREELLITKLNKALFYFDLVHLRDLGETFTDGNYRALAQGPVVSSYQKRLVKPMVSRGLVEESTIGRSKPIRLLKEGRALSLDGRSRDIGRQIADWMDTRTAREVSDYSHRNEGWRIAYDAGLARGEGARRIDLLIAMDQILEADPWLEEPSSFAETDSNLEGVELTEWI